jgi:polyribonucleotide nucleotidyltransferase
MQKTQVQREIAGRTLSIETGTMAKLAAGSVTVQYGETVILAAVVRSNPREGIDFFPMQVEYRERRSAAGKFPGGFMKREGRPTNKEILTARLIDRPLRPLFPKGYKDEVQVHLTVLAFDGENDPDVLAGIAASAALSISNIPWNGPTAHCRVGIIDGDTVLFPTVYQVDESDIDLVVAGTDSHVNMIEVGAYEVPEDEVADAIEVGHKACQEIVEMIGELVDEVGAEKDEAPAGPDEALVAKVKKLAATKIKKAKGEPGKAERHAKINAIRDEVMAELAPEPGDKAAYHEVMGQKAMYKTVKNIFSEVEEEITREIILDGKRPDGRGPDDIRPISCETDLLPRVHGSALFTRGETQSLCNITLGTKSDEQLVDGLIEEYSEKFMLHYNFPSYSVGEVRPIRGVSRRELGHGALAQRALVGVLPDLEDFPYTIRVISDILESNGSSSMASACCGCLAMMDAGVPLTAMVAGISVGLIQQDGQDLLITDILGEEDHFGDMDFKVCGTRDGITAVQLDIKIEGLSYDLIRKTLHRAKEARGKILDMMEETISEPRREISKNAPRLLTVKIDPEKIGKLIGPGGKTIKKLQEDTDTRIDIEEDGTVFISSPDAQGAEKCRDIVEAMTQSVQVGKLYKGEVVSVKDFGCFVEIAPETDGLVHVSELSNHYVDRVSDIVKVGEVMDVKVVLIDDQGRIKLSRKEAFKELGIEEPEPENVGRKREGGEGEGDGERRPRRRSRGGRGNRDDG